MLPLQRQNAGSAAHAEVASLLTIMIALSELRYTLELSMKKFCLVPRAQMNIMVSTAFAPLVKMVG